MNNKELVQRWFEEVWNRGNTAVIDELMAPEADGVTETGRVKGPDDFRRLVYEPFRKAFPKVRVDIDALVAEGDDVAIKWTVSGKHEGPLAELPPTGRETRISGMTWLKFREGRIVGGSDSYNLHGLIAYLSSGQESASVGPA